MKLKLTVTDGTGWERVEEARDHEGMVDVLLGFLDGHGGMSYKVTQELDDDEIEPPCVDGSNDHDWKWDNTDSRGEWMRETEQCTLCNVWRERYESWDQNGLTIRDEYTYEKGDDYKGVEA